MNLTTGPTIFYILVALTVIVVVIAAFKEAR